jgi:pimeloyl-ACP methyl ester carboxylesterase
MLRSFALSPGYLPAVRASVFDAPAGLAAITCPILILQGTLDPLVAMQSPRYLAFVPHATWRWLPGCGHVGMSDDPTLVAGLMIDFLRDVPAPASSRTTPRRSGG